MIDNHDHIYSIASELMKYAEIEGTEIGESALTLIQVTQYLAYFSDEFVESLMYELEGSLATFKESATIVEREETITHKVYSIEWE